MVLKEDSFCKGRRETQGGRGRHGVYMRAEAVGDEGEGNVREKQAKRRYGDIKLWLICRTN